MKNRKILVLYANKDLKSISSAERMMITLIHEMERQGRELKYVNNKGALFKDGTKISKYPLGEYVRGFRATHVYLDEDIKNLENAGEFISTVIFPMVLPKGNYENVDAEGSSTDRIFVYGNEGIGRYFKDDTTIE